MAGPAVLEPEVLVAVEAAVGKRQGRLRRRGGGLHPHRALGTGLQGAENGGGASLLFPGAAGVRGEDPLYRKRPLCFCECVCASGCVVWVCCCLARSLWAYPECAHRFRALVRRAGSWRYSVVAFKEFTV